MRLGLISACVLVVAALLFPAGSARAASDTTTINIEAQLVWGTNEPKPDSKFKPVGPKMSAKLKSSPFKWDHYFEVNKQIFKVKFNEEKIISMSKHCEIRLTNLGDSQLRFKLFGHEQLVSDVTQALPKGELLVTGGDAENATAWFVILRQAD